MGQKTITNPRNDIECSQILCSNIGGEKFDFGTSAEDVSGLKVSEANTFVLHTISRVVGKV